MAHVPPPQSSPGTAPKRPRGILKNSTSYQHMSVDPHSPVAEQPNEPSPNAGPTRPGPPGREMSEKEIVQMNTELNAGGRRRNSSNPQGSLSRRQSGQSSNGLGSDAMDESQMRLKWDEANLYLNEGQMGGRMKIDEPKTPFTTGYDPADDEEEIANIDAQTLAVDELDMNRSRQLGVSPRGNSTNGQAPSSRARETDIPGLDLGEPEVDPHVGMSDGERRVTVDGDYDMTNGSDDQQYGHGEDEDADMTGEEREKHRKFEEMRKKHYEMKNVKNLLGHPEELEALDEEER